MRWIDVTALAASVAALLISGGATAQSGSTVYGQAKSLGNGFAQLYAELDAAGAPRVRPYYGLVEYRRHLSHAIG